VAAATRARVQQVARDLGYRPSSRARSLVAGRNAAPRCAVVNLGFTPEGFSQSSYGPLLPGVMAQAGVAGLDVHVVTIGQEVDPAEGLHRLAAEDRADGVILVTFLALTPSDVRPLEAAQLPFVLVNRHFDYFDSYAGHHAVNSVVPDWRGVGRHAVEHLRQLGHRRLVALFRERSTSTLLDRERGWQAGAAACGLAPADAPIVRYLDRGPGDVDDQRGYEWGTRLLTEGLPATGAPPTAILAFNDQCAHGVLRAARALGVDVPRDLSVIGIDDDIARYTFPPLCSYNPHYHALGVKAIEALHALLRGDATAPARVTLPAQFVCRGSCGPATAGAA
jgi:LacI family transcriptional regulator